MKKPENPKERNLVKGAMRRVFSRSDLRREALARQAISHSDTARPRVTKWSWCADCGVVEPTYLMEVDHIEPLVPLTKSLDDLTWDEVAERLWCDLDNLRAVCKPCHREKSKVENKERRANKGSKKR